MAERSKLETNHFSSCQAAYMKHPIAARDARAAFVKDLRVERYFEGTEQKMVPTEPAWRELSFTPFSQSPMFDPCLLPR